MKLLDILTSPWAIQPEKLVEIQAIYATHLRGEKIDIAGVEARLGKPLANEPKPYQVVDGVAVIPLDGVIAKRMNMFTQISGGVSTQLAERDIKAALSDPSVHSIILAIDSPGGPVDGTQTLADTVFQARSQKPIVSLASGTMASAAYWIGSAAQAVYITDATTQVGSIGVVTKHVDVSGAEAKDGIVTTEIYSGKFKRIASQHAPLSKEGKAHMQAQMDYLYSLFVGAVATNRGVSTDQVLSDMADGQIFIGQQAIDAGLVDGVSTLPKLIAELNAAHKGQSAGAAQTSQTKPKGTIQMDRTTLAATEPALLSEILAEGAAAERERIQSVQAQAIPGHEALIATLAFDGKTTAGEAAIAVLSADRSKREAVGKALAADAPAPVVQAPTPAVTVPAAADDTLPLEDRAKKTWDATPAIRAEFGDSFSAYLAFERASAAGSVKFLSKTKQ